MKRLLFSVGCVILASNTGFTQSKGRHVEIAVRQPSSAHPIVSILQVVEGDTASIEIPNVAKFGFVPTIKSTDDDTLVVDVFDLSQTPARKLDTIETSIHGRFVTAKTNPQIDIHANYIQPR
jgi:hypothetical protein